MKQAPTIYNKCIEEAVARHCGGKIAYGVIMDEFRRAGFTVKKANERIKEMAMLNGHTIDNGWIKYA